MSKYVHLINYNKAWRDIACMHTETMEQEIFKDAVLSYLDNLDTIAEVVVNLDSYPIISNMHLEKLQKEFDE